MTRIFTIGHSTHTIEHFRELLLKHGVSAVADVRSVPASRFTPQFNRDALKRLLADVDVQYAFLGRELGARSDNPACYEDGQVQYDRLAKTPEFARGIERLRDGIETQQIAVMCAEQDPLDCHRTVLVARVLHDLGVSVTHIHADGGLESHYQAMHRLMARFDLDEPDLLSSETERMDEALKRQEQRIAYVQKADQMDESRSP